MCYVDDNGTFPWAAVGIVVLVVVAIAVDHALAAHQPENGFAVVNEPTGKGANMKGLYAKGSGFSVDDTGVTLCGTEAGLLSLSVEGKHSTITPFDCLTASASAGLDWSGKFAAEASAVISIYSPGVDFVVPCGDYDIAISAELLVGALGVGASFDTEEKKFKITPPTKGIGYSLDIDVNRAR